MNDSRRIAEAAMNELWGHQEKGALTSSLATFRQLGHSKEVVDFVLDPDSYYFPSLSGNTLLTPAGAREEQIAVVALEEGTYRRSAPSLHYLQELAVKNAGVSMWDIRDAKKAFATLEPTFETSGGSHGTASTFYNLVPFGKSGTEWIDSKPMVILNVDPQRVSDEPMCPGVVLHELVHVSQSLTNPITNGTFSLRKELEAYAVQSQLLDSYTVPYGAGTAMAATVNTFRKRYLGDNVYEPTPEFTQAMARDDILHKVVKNA